MTQHDKIKQLFKDHPNQWIPLPEVMRFAAQYNARIHELRRDGMHIQNRTENVDGQKHSWFRYVYTTQLNGNQMEMCL